MAEINPRGLASGFQSGFGMMSDYFQQQHQKDMDRQRLGMQQQRLDLKRQRQEVLNEKGRLATQAAQRKLDRQETRQAIRNLQTARDLETVDGDFLEEQAQHIPGGMDTIRGFVNDDFVEAKERMDEGIRRATGDLATDAGSEQSQMLQEQAQGLGLSRAGKQKPTTAETLNSQEVIDAANTFFQPDLKRRIDNVVAQDGKQGKVSDARISGLVPLGEGRVGVEMEITADETDDQGERTGDQFQYRAPATENESSDDADPVKGVPIETMLDQAEGLSRINRAFNQDPQAKAGLQGLLMQHDPDYRQQVMESRRARQKMLANGWEQIEGGDGQAFMVNPLTGQRFAVGRPEPQTPGGIGSLGPDEVADRIERFNSSVTDNLDFWPDNEMRQQASKAMVRREAEKFYTQFMNTPQGQRAVPERVASTFEGELKRRANPERLNRQARAAADQWLSQQGGNIETWDDIDPERHLPEGYNSVERFRRDKVSEYKQQLLGRAAQEARVATLEELTGRDIKQGPEPEGRRDEIRARLKEANPDASEEEIEQEVDRTIQVLKQSQGGVSVDVPKPQNGQEGNGEERTTNQGGFGLGNAVQGLWQSVPAQSRETLREMGGYATAPLDWFSPPEEGYQERSQARLLGRGQ